MRGGDRGGACGSGLQRGAGARTPSAVHPQAVTAAALLALIREERIVELPDGFAAGDDLFAAGLDSMAVMQLLVAVGEKWQVRLGAADVTRENFGSAAALARLLERRGRGG